MMKISNHHNHPYHLVTISPWPLLSSLSILNMLIGSIKWFNLSAPTLFILSLITLMFNSLMWWRDVIRESTFQGCHTFNVSNLLRLGMILFIISEMFFFISFFWTFFHSSLSPNIEIGSNWPPQNITPFNPLLTPLLNTIILISSGISITWSHWSIINKNFKESLISLMLTIILGVYFTYLQYSEYTDSSFSMNDSIYGATFFLITGFHGIHVMIGTMFIMTSFYRLIKFHFSNKHHFGFEASAWYWHFVDIIWLMVYMFLYWWPFYL